MIKMFNFIYDERLNENNKLILFIVLLEILKGNVILEWDWGIGRFYIRWRKCFFWKII